MQVMGDGAQVTDMKNMGNLRTFQWLRDGVPVTGPRTSSFHSSVTILLRCGTMPAGRSAPPNSSMLSGLPYAALPLGGDERAGFSVGRRTAGTYIGP